MTIPTDTRNEPTMNKKELIADDDDDDEDTDVAGFTAVDFSGVDFDCPTVDVADNDHKMDPTLQEWLKWERATPFYGFVASFETTGDEKDDLNDLHTIAKLLEEGRYGDVLRSTMASCLFIDSNHSFATSSVQLCISQRVMEIASVSVEACIVMELVGIAALNLFLQNNYTGPALQDELLADINPHPGMVPFLLQPEKEPHPEPIDKNTVHTAILAELVVDGEWPCPVSHTPYFLLVARAILSTLANAKLPEISSWTKCSSTSATRNNFTGSDNTNSLVGCEHSYRDHALCLNAIQIWSARACIAHERLLQAKRPTERLWTETNFFFEACRSLYCSQDSEMLDSQARHAAAVVWLEWGLAEHYFDRPKKGQPSFKQALHCTGLSVEVTGAVGKRTKFQQEATAQMVVRARSTNPDVSEKSKTSMDEANLIKGQLIEHSQEGILLERIKFEQDEDQSPHVLTIVDQSILLALCLDVKNSNPSDCLTGEEMGAFLARVLDHHDDWMVYSTALLERAWLEFERSHARERAILQMQALVDQHTSRLTITQSTVESIESSAPVQERLIHLHSIVYPPRWSILQDLAERYASLGIVSSAADLFAEIELWDSVVECYRRAGRVSKAEEIVRKQLAITETPRMWAALGDITKEPEYYQKAIDLSNGRFFDAYLALAEHYFGKGDIGKAAGLYTKALQVRSLIPSAWFRLGAINMQLGLWSEALRAFSEVVLQKPDEAEAWANIAAVHMHNKQPTEAYPALNESLKHMRSNWRVWVSKLYTCLDLDKFDEAIQACNTLLDLRAERQASEGIPPLEEKCVRAIVGGSLRKFHDSNSDEFALQSSRRTLTRLHTLLVRIKSSSDSAPWIFETLTVLHEQTSQDSGKVLEMLEEEYRSLLGIPGWEKDNIMVVKLCQVVESMVQIYCSNGNSKEGLAKSRFALRGVIQQIGAKRVDDPTTPDEVHALETSLIDIEIRIKEVK